MDLLHGRHDECDANVNVDPIDRLVLSPMTVMRLEWFAGAFESSFDRWAVD